MFVLRGGARGWFVARSGDEHAYTADLLRARIFMTLTDAEQEKCGNETVVSVTSLLEDNIQ